MTALASPRIAAVSLRDGNSLVSPSAPAWRGVDEFALALVPTPLAAQPSAYVRASWADRPYGETGTVQLNAAIADEMLYLRLSWKAPEPRPAITDNDVFADGCAVLFPADGREAELSTMGDELRPVEAWHWRAGTAVPFVIQAKGLGTTERAKQHSVTAGAQWDQGSWSVVFRRGLAEAGVPLAAGQTVPIGVAVWQGARAERAGIASHTPGWIALDLPS